jgi:4-hydroxybenzoate polyprenyltransferase
MGRDFLALLRPWQWTKNLFIFLPLFFALKIFELDLLIRACEAFVFFCLLSSAVYVGNDIFDLAEDRRHPAKRNRPLAAGRVSVKQASTALVTLLFLGLTGSWLMGPLMLALSILYLLINVLYTLKVKHHAIIDIMFIATGFVIRIFVGGVATGVTIYPWIVVMTFLLALFLALGKRREDLIISTMSGEKTRKSIEGYNLPFIDAAMIVMAAVTIVAYVMYTLSSEVMAKFHTHQLYLTTFFVILGLLRYLQIAMVDQKISDPTEVILRDRFLQLAIVGWIISFGLLIYLR